MDKRVLTLEFENKDKENFYDSLHNDSLEVMQNTLTIVSNFIGHYGKSTMTEEEVMGWIKEVPVYSCLDDDLLKVYGLEEDTTVYDLVCSPLHFSLGIYAMLAAAREYVTF